MKRRKVKNTDIVMILDIVFLVIFGFIAMTSASYPRSLKDYGGGFHFVIRQGIFLILGIIGMFMASKFPRKNLQRISLFLFIMTVIIVGLLWVPKLGHEVGGQIRWIKIPLIGFTFQPSDLMKLSSIIFMAHFLSVNIHRIKNNNIFILILCIMGISVGPIMIKDFSTAIVMGLTLFFMFWASGMSKKQFLVMVVIGTILLSIMLLTEDFSYRIKRITGLFTDDPAQRLDSAYHAFQSLYAIAMGGYSGVGLFHSRQKYTNVPEAHTDFIFAIICEEFGVIGATLLIILFIIFIYRGFMIAYKTKNLFDKIMAIGITTSIGIQAFFNMGVSVKLLPATGLTLPFISYGGTALVIALIEVGLLLRIAKDEKR
ncbi:MAG: putative peptidoglycan glycosyltransferase FtsW [Tissierellia bacterium]|nr:putative peptidoglycan glycosyltransferase FtsW [Tissierellia bacterium]